MNVEEIRKNKPNGTTHYCSEPYIGYFYFDFQWFEWDEREDCWPSLHFDPRNIEILNHFNRWFLQPLLATIKKMFYHYV